VRPRGVVGGCRRAGGLITGSIRSAFTPLREHLVHVHVGRAPADQARFQLKFDAGKRCVGRKRTGDVELKQRALDPAGIDTTHKEIFAGAVAERARACVHGVVFDRAEGRQLVTARTGRAQREVALVGAALQRAIRRRENGAPGAGRQAACACDGSRRSELNGQLRALRCDG
jgi:hypothetical protein